MPLDYEKDYPNGMVASNDPNTLLLPDTDRKDWRVGFLFPLVGGISGGLYPLGKNWFREVPLRSGIFQFPLWFAIGAMSGKLVEDVRNYLNAEKDAHYRQYIRNHPQDFEPAERKKVAELFKPWQPIR